MQFFTGNQIETKLYRGSFSNFIWFKDSGSSWLVYKQINLCCDKKFCILIAGWLHAFTPVIKLQKTTHTDECTQNWWYLKTDLCCSMPNSGVIILHCVCVCVCIHTHIHPYTYTHSLNIEFLYYVCVKILLLRETEWTWGVQQLPMNLYLFQKFKKTGQK